MTWNPLHTGKDWACKNQQTSGSESKGNLKNLLHKALGPFVDWEHQDGLLLMSCQEHFNEDINLWDVSFEVAKSFNKPLNAWNTIQVKSMNGMFNRASEFNQPLDSWDTSKVEDMSFMFAGTLQFDQVLNTWKAEQVQEMQGMFLGARAFFNQPLLSWNTSNVRDVVDMLFYAGSFNQPIFSWDLSRLECYKGIFHLASSFRQALPEGWDSAEALRLN